MRAGFRGIVVVLALSLVTSCGVESIRRPAPAPSTVATPAGTSTPSAGPSSGPADIAADLRPDCAREAQPRRLLTTDDVWSMADLDAMSQIASQLSTSCDIGASWPSDPDTLWAALIKGWPGYRTEGVYYTAAVSMLNTSGKTMAEQVMLFRLPTSRGLAMVTDQAKAAHATAGAAVSGATIYRYPPAGDVHRVLIVDRTTAINLTAPSDVDMDKLVRSAVRRAH